MGSLVVKIDAPTRQRMQRRQGWHSDIDMLLQTQQGIDEGVVPMAYDADAVRISLKNILMWRVGESVLRPEFGHNIHRSMYEQSDTQSRERVCQEIKRAIEVNEPRVDVVSVSVAESETDPNGATPSLNVRVVYRAKADENGDTASIEQEVRGR